MPEEARGRGAWERRQSTPLTPSKRARETGPVEAVNLLRRKLRRSASSRLGSQSEALWAGITSAGLERKHDEADDWTEPALAQQPVQPSHINSTADTDSAPAEAPPQEDPASRARGPFADESDGIFAGSLVYPYGFDRSKVWESACLRVAVADQHRRLFFESISTATVQLSYATLQNSTNSRQMTLREGIW